jgi:hypothetical protein
MPAKSEGEQQTSHDRPGREQMSALISKHVMHTLGRPSDFQKVQVRPLWENCYRVNVFVGEDSVSARVAHSFFLVADGNGNIVASTPKLAPQYLLKEGQGNQA